jgi:hypothetical protein
MPERLIDPATWTPDQRRQAEMMVAIDIWTSRTCGAWVEDGFAAFKTDAPFGQDMTLDLMCECFDEHTLSLDLPCLFVDDYRDLRVTGHGNRVDKIISRIDRRYGGPLSVGAAIDVDHPLAEPLQATRLDTGGGFVVVQQRYLNAAINVCGVDSWTLVGIKPQPGQTRIGACVIGERDGEIVALIMPMVYRDPERGEAIGYFEPAAEPPAGRGAGGDRG